MATQSYRVPGYRIERRDLELIEQGIHARLYDKLGAHRVEVDGTSGVTFSVLAPQANAISVVGDFNGWKRDADPLERQSGGIWHRFVPDVPVGTIYKLLVVGKDGSEVLKSDPFAFRAEGPPRTGSIVTDLDYAWGDEDWVAGRAERQGDEAPWSIYELHLGSWRKDGERRLGYLELADALVPYLLDNGFTHVEFMPPFEHPYFPSWGYQVTGFFAATSRYGTPQELMQLIDRLHRAGIGVVVDWTPAHFPADNHGLARFDGTRMFEYPDPRVGFHPEWNTYVFNYGRGDVQSFLISSAAFWAERYHVDAFRVDAVASMLYLDYARKEGEWIKNKHGGRENLEAVSFLKRFNTQLKERFPGVRTIAEESTSWPGVTRPVHLGGLGFDMKWDMGWMHDTLEYFKLDPIHRRHHHGKITFRMMYAWSEKFVLPLSHDEVVHGKSSLVGKMHGDEWQKFAGLRALYGYMWGLPGKKLLFMGGEIGQWNEWSHERSIEWELEQYPLHAGLRSWVADLNRLYREIPALHVGDFSNDGFEWIDCADSEQSVVAFLRRDKQGGQTIVVGNFTPVPRHDYRVGAPTAGRWAERLNSDAESYGGSGIGNCGAVETIDEEQHGRPCTLVLNLPPLSVLFLQGPDAVVEPEASADEDAAGDQHDAG